jgi:hypothetical protein
MVRNIRKLLRRYRTNVFYLQGTERYTEYPINIMLIGNPLDFHYLTQLIYGGEYHITDTARVWNYELSRLIQACDCDLAIASDVSKQFASSAFQKHFFYLPRWVGGDVDVPTALQTQHISKNVKTDIGRIKRNGLTYQVFTDCDSYARFYEEMYVPYIRSVYGSGSAIESFNNFKSVLGRSQLLLVHNATQYISGSILLDEGDHYRGWTLGIKDGCNDYKKQGALAALYYFGIQLAAQAGYPRFHFGGSRPFLKDGALQYKRKWGIQLRDYCQTGFAIKPLQNTCATRSFLTQNPFFTLGESGLQGCVFVENAGANPQCTWAEDYQKLGIDPSTQFKMYTLGCKEFSDNPAAWITRRHCQAPSSPPRQTSFTQRPVTPM